MNLRWLKKSDGTMVLQSCEESQNCETGDMEYDWIDVPIIDEPKQKKELWEVLEETWDKVPYPKNSQETMKIIAQAAREFIEEERRGKG